MPLQVLGMVPLNIHIGDKDSCRVWTPVVPDRYLNRDLLLGWDIISKADLTWKARGKLLIWGGRCYDVTRIRGSFRHVKWAQKKTGEPPQNLVQLKKKLSLKPYQSKIIYITVPLEEGTQLIVSPKPKYSSQTTELLVKVNSEKAVPIIIDNPSKTHKVLKPGVILGTYEPYEDTVEEPYDMVRHNRISNEIIPTAQEKLPGATREERLKHLLQLQKWSHLDESVRQSLYDLVMEHEKLIVVDETDLGTMEGDLAHIHVKDPLPCRTPQYRYPETAKVIITKMLEEMEGKGVIEPSNAAWLSPIVLVSKPDGSKRMCLDFRKVNSHLAADVYPLPRLEDLVNSASGHKCYATLDLKDAYHQITLDQESRDLTTFTDGVTLYRFKRLPFGLSCAPAIFARKMAEILTPLLKKGWVKNYLDDVIVMADSHKQLIERLSELFKLLSDSGVKLNLNKCDLVKNEVKFLGHVVSEQGSKPDPKNVEAIRSMKPPQNVRDVRRFVGMTAFYRKFVPKFSNIASPLTKLTKIKQKFEWSEKCQQAFEELKDRITNPPVLVNYKSEMPVQLVTDASEECVGAVLHQVYPNGEQRPLGYFSKRLTDCEQRYSVTDKEALGVVYACRHFHHWLWGRHFEIFTDHQPLTTIFTSRTKSPRVTRWILEMREYHYRIKYVKGKLNVVADQLSRPVRVVTYPPETDWLGFDQEQFIEQQRADPTWSELINYLEGSIVPGRKIARATLDQFALRNRVLYYVKFDQHQNMVYCLVVPRNLVKKAAELSHTSNGHFGQYKSIKAAEAKYYWPGLKNDIVQFTKSCISCQQFKSGSALSYQYQELPEVNRPLQRIAIDLTDMVSGQDGYRYILTIIDHFSRYLKVFPLKSKQASGIVSKLDSYVADLGTPEAILLDNALEFTGSELRNWADRMGSVLLYTTPYHPESNGAIERMHRTLKGVLAQLCNGYPSRWPKLLNACQTRMNAAIHTATGVSPFAAFHNRQPLRGSAQQYPVINNPEPDHDKIKDIIIAASRRSQRRYRAIANRKRRQERVGTGALVWIKNETSIPGSCTKLNPKWRGPYRVTSVLNQGVAYIVESPFDGSQTQRAAGKVRPYIGRSEIVPEMEECIMDVEEGEEKEDPLPPRTRQPPRRLIEEG